MGATNAELDSIAQQIIEVEYRNNPIVLQRMLILKQLEPYAHMSLNEVLNVYSKGLLNKDKVLIKMNFNELISKFERENIDIVEFGANTDLNTKIKTINAKLLEYVREHEFAATPGAESSVVTETERSV